MCLLVTQSSQSPTLTDAWLKDFYSANPDGVGVMYVDGGELVIEKILPTNAEDFVHFYNNHIDGKDCAFHLRMKTHGDIDMLNCHPYEILNKAEHGIDMWLMHNGILHTGNAEDTSKSDTWHYIKDYLRPMLITNPDFAFHPSFADLVGEHISNNRFVIMDSLGRMATVNQSQGVYWGGRWLSNTYAWSAPVDVDKELVEDVAHAVAQIEKEPNSYRYGKGSYYNYTGSYYDGDDLGYEASWVFPQVSEKYGIPPEDEDFEIDDLLSELEITRKIKRVSRKQARAFVDYFGIDGFVEVAYMALDKSISCEWFTKVISDFAEARSAFPWLERERPKNLLV